LDNYQHLVVIGAQRSGSTLLYGLLDQHPDIFMSKPVRPEPKYFMSNEKGSYHHYLDTVFPERPTSGYLGEKSTSYYEIPEVAEAIRETIPNAKLIFIMRNPVQRALSNYRFSKQNGLENRSLKDVFIDEVELDNSKGYKTSVNPFDYLGRGEYLRYIKIYIELLGRDNFMPVFFEDLQLKRGVEKIWSFLNLPLVEPILDESYRNHSKSEEVDTVVLDKLQSHFRQQNRDLADYLELDLDPWDNN
tara:strand:- start:492 stop:1229 length:738 start_codon:yes stop_codon:yes gene_type:complete